MLFHTRPSEGTKYLTSERVSSGVRARANTSHAHVRALKACNLFDPVLARDAVDVDERAGVVALLCSDAAVAQRVQQQLSRTIRLTHSSPPQHGAAIAATILGDPARSAAWRAELKGMAERLRDSLGIHDAHVDAVPGLAGVGAGGSWQVRACQGCRPRVDGSHW